MFGLVAAALNTPLWSADKVLFVSLVTLLQSDWSVKVSDHTNMTANIVHPHRDLNVLLLNNKCTVFFQ